MFFKNGTLNTLFGCPIYKYLSDSENISLYCIMVLILFYCLIY